MKIISTNIGEAVEIEWRGKKVKTGIFKKPTNLPLAIEKEDVRGDHVMDRRYHGGVDKACYLYSADHYDYWRIRYPDLDWQWGMFGENLTVEGIDESTIRVGDVYRLGTALVQVTQPRQPCFKLGVRFNSQKVVREFLESPFPGVYVRVLEEGTVEVGDEMLLERKATGNLSLKEVFALFSHHANDAGKLKKAIEMPELASACRKDLNKLLQFADE
ncbi:MAG TPA: MOSC domain-containing protein [Sunxiuqinia sp.]|nr:MOSC domain-containing protein [Sunxiuqinia sp.]